MFWILVRWSGRREEDTREGEETWRYDKYSYTSFDIIEFAEMGIDWSSFFSIVVTGLVTLKVLASWNEQKKSDTLLFPKSLLAF